MGDPPALTRSIISGLALYVDEGLRRAAGIVVAFSERTGGVSSQPYATLNLATHVGDDPEAVDVNRDRLLASCGVGHLRDQLVTAHQTHGVRIADITSSDAGRGARVFGRVVPPIESADGLLTAECDIPLLMLYADCVPIVFVAVGPVPAVAVVHAGWRGVFRSLPGSALRRVARAARCGASEVRVYVGAHIGACCYEVSTRLAADFALRFGSSSVVRRHVDLAKIVRATLSAAGADPRLVVAIGECTHDARERFFSYRAAGTTGRHGALALIMGGERPLDG